MGRLSAQPFGRVLIIAGSDSSGGAGIQADIKTINALGGYSASVLTALTAQDTKSVYEVLDVAPYFIEKQIKIVLGDIGADICKLGMLHKAKTIQVVMESLPQNLGVVADPVMVAKSGAVLLEKDARDVYLGLIVPRARLLTPNMPEAAILTNLSVETLDEQKKAGEVLLRQGAKSVLVKGGHGTGFWVQDVLVTAEGMFVFETKRIKTKNTHGTGCSLASAIACGLAQNLDEKKAVRRAIDFVQQAILYAPQLGRGSGPLAHYIKFNEV